MAEKKAVSNKGAKATTAKKAPAKKATPKKATPDLSKLAAVNTIEATVDSKHMSKGKVYKGISESVAKALVNRGLAKIV